MKKLPIFAALALLLGLLSCAPNQQELQQSIVQREAQAKQLTSPDRELMEELTEAYGEYAESFAQDSLAPLYLMRQSDLLLAYERPAEAAAAMEKILSDYKGFRKYPLVLLSLALLYETKTAQQDKAELYYKRFLADYPSHPQADDAKASLAMLGKTVEEQFDEIVAKDSLK